jgi:hypothetical protein
MDDEKKTPTGDYGVGYGRPPKEHQFKKGSGKTSDRRPARKKCGTTDIAAVLAQPLTVKQGGTTRQMSAFEAGLRGLVKKALNDRDLRSMLEFLKLCEKHGIIEAPPAALAGGGILVIPKTWDYKAWSDLLDETGSAASPNGGTVTMKPWKTPEGGET